MLFYYFKNENEIEAYECEFVPSKIEAFFAKEMCDMQFKSYSAVSKPKQKTKFSEFALVADVMDRNRLVNDMEFCPSELIGNYLDRDDEYGFWPTYDYLFSNIKDNNLFDDYLEGKYSNVELSKVKNFNGEVASFFIAPENVDMIGSYITVVGDAIAFTKNMETYHEMRRTGEVIGGDELLSILEATADIKLTKIYELRKSENVRTRTYKHEKNS